MTLQAENGRDLWLNDTGAPRFLTPIVGNVILQAKVASLSPDIPALGGLILWKDDECHVYLERGRGGPDDIRFYSRQPQNGQRGHYGDLIGRGNLKATLDRKTVEAVVLRLEREGDVVNAYCSEDEEEWFTLGRVDFPVEDPLYVGFYAVGEINRTIYPGAHLEGTALGFYDIRIMETDLPPSI
jgi:hypothetical protein